MKLQSVCICNNAFVKLFYAFASISKCIYMKDWFGRVCDSTLRCICSDDITDEIRISKNNEMRDI